MPVFHLDIESFMTVVERVKDPLLRKRPLVIAPTRARATVLAASPDAKALGVTRDMPCELLRRDFPGVLVKPPDYRLYERAGRATLDVVGDFSPLIEPLGYGHIAMDMTGMRRLFGTLEDAASKLCRELQQRTTLSGTVGIAANKLVSSIAAKEIQKNRESLYQVTQGDEADFLSPLTCKALPEWRDPAVRRLLFELNLRQIKQIQCISRDVFSFAVGQVGVNLHRHALGIDPSPVTAVEDTRALSEAFRFFPDTNDDKEIRAAIYTLIEKLCGTLRAKEVQANRAHVALRYTDDVWRRRNYRFGRTQSESPIYKAVTDTFEKLCDRRHRVRYIRVTFENLSARQLQCSLFERPKLDRLHPGLDQIRAKFGEDAIGFGRNFATREPNAVAAKTRVDAPVPPTRPPKPESAPLEARPAPALHPAPVAAPAPAPSRPPRGVVPVTSAPRPAPCPLKLLAGAGFAVRPPGPKPGVTFESAATLANVG